MLNIRKANSSKPPRVLIYGIEGVGKTTLGAKADKPIFITPEGGADHVLGADNKPVDEIAGVKTWENLRAAVKSLIKEAHDFKTLCIDSADWVEKLCHAKIIGTSGYDIIRANGGYGAGYSESENLHRELIGDLSTLRDEKGMAIIVTAHYQVKEIKDPDMVNDYDSYQIKCHEKVSSLWREWVDALFFARFSTFIKKDQKDAKAKARAIGDDSRIVYTTKRPAFQAKNRYNMPPELPFTEDFWNVFMGYAKKGVQPEVARDPIDYRMEIDHWLTFVKDEVLTEKVKQSVVDAGDNPQQLQVIIDRLKEITNQKGA